MYLILFENIKYMVEGILMICKNQNSNWNQWFAGVIDGDGCFYINKKKEISFEVTTAIQDARILYDIKNKLKSGSIKLRSGSLSMRYRVKKRSAIIDIINRVNGKLHNTARLKKFKEVCNFLNISLTSTPTLIKNQNAYLSGLIDSDGTITISALKTSQLDSQKFGNEGKIARLTHSRGHNQIYLKITSIDKQNLIFIQQSYQFGKIRLEKTNQKKKQKYHWVISSYEEFIKLYEYLKKYPLKSVKMHRVRLVRHYFQYKKLKYHLKDPDTQEYKIWAKFCRSWFKYTV